MRIFVASLLTTLFLATGAQAVAIDATSTPQKFSQLNTSCNSTNIGSRATITDGPASPAWGTPVTAGGGPTTVGIYCDGGAWKVYAGGATTPVPVPTAVLPPPTTNQGNYGTGCSSGSCLTFDDHWAAATTLDLSKWFGGLVINNTYLDGGAGFQWPYSAWTICDCNGGTQTVFFDYPYGYSTNNVGATFSPLKKASDGSLQMSFGPNNFFAGKGVNYVGAAISSAYTPATEIPHAGGIMQWRAKMDNGLLYGSYPGMQCSANPINGVNGTSYNANFEYGYTWTGTPLTNVGFSVNNLAATTSNGGTLSTGVGAVPSTNDLTHWHTFALEYTGDNGTRKWQYYVDGVLQDTANATQPAGTDFNCSWQLFNAPSADNSWHSGTTSSNPGPFSMWISDIQFYKKPGT